jgi:hypothetical protein
MSSFVVEPSTINRIATYLYRSDRDTAMTAKSKLAQIGINNEEELGEAMYRLNLQAVDARYGDLESANLCDLDYRYRYELGQLIPVIKSLQCWRYQCSEGAVPETELYQIMQGYLHTLALRVVAGTKEYELAQWA